jgi:hypothetical protein
VLSIAAGGTAPLSPGAGAAAILIAASSNNLLKAAYGAFAGGRAAAESAVVLALLALGSTGASWIARVIRNFAVAQYARGSDAGLATTRNPGNVGLRASGRNALLASMTWSGRIRSGSTRCDRDPHFNSDACGLGHILPGSKTI